MNPVELTSRDLVPGKPLREFPYFHATLALLLAVTLFRLWYCTTLGLLGDEAYYWVCSRHLDLSYFDKGPGAAVTIALGTHLFGNTVFGIRFFAVLLSFATGLSIFALARMLFSERVAWFSVLLTLAIPLFAVGSLLMTIDPLSVFFWTLAAIAFWKAKDTPSLGPWLAAGALVGIGGLAKYTNLVELLCFALFCLCCTEYRSQFRRPQFYAILGGALVCSIPVLIWNSRHDWITVEHLVHRGALDGGWHFSPVELSFFLCSQAGVISPLIFIGIAGSLFGPRLDPKYRAAVRFLLCLFLPLVVFYLVLSANKAGQANWTAPAYVAGVILFAARWTFGGANARWIRNFGVVAVILGLLETLVMHNTYWLRLPPGRDPLDRARGFDLVAKKAAELSAKEETQCFIADKYMLASLLSFYLPGRPDTFMPFTPRVANQYSIWPGYRTLPSGCSALYVSDTIKIPKALLNDFSEVKLLDHIEPTYRGRLLKEHYFFLCRGLRTTHS
jgi:4-amino-4-deoxy-L-arabinose transferase-like glycosyltransferase